MRYSIALMSMAALGAMAAGANAEDAKLPRYELGVGRHLHYVTDSKFTYQNGTLEAQLTLDVTAVAKNADGSYRVIVRTGDREVQNRSGEKSTSPKDAKERVTYTRIDITPDGRLVPGATDSSGSLPTESPMVLPPLPADAKQLSGSWEKQPPMPGMTEILKSSSAPAEGKWIFESTSAGLFKDIYGINDDRTYQFDLTAGVVTAIDNRQKQDYGFTGTGAGRTRLESNEVLSADQTKALAADAQILLDAEHAMHQKFEKLDASTDAGKLKASLKEMLSAAMEKVSTPEMKTAIQEMISDSERSVDYSVDGAKRIAQIVGKPLAEVSGTDLQGKKRQLSEFRGKVLVLDFWYRGCGWCIRSMPQLKQVADDFKNEPFELIGMNTDRNAADARFVIDAMKLNYSTIQIDNDTAKQLNVQAFPSLLIVDRTGVVRKFDEGYSPHLRDDLEKEIRPLLKDSPQAQ